MPQSLTVTQAAAILKVSRSRVHALIRQKRIQATRQGHQLVIAPMQLLKLQGRKNGRPRKGQAVQPAEPPLPVNALNVIEQIRKAVWRVYLSAPKELKPIVGPKFIDFARELVRTGDLDW